jgi:ATP-dependent DNA helicase RecQ
MSEVVQDLQSVLARYWGFTSFRPLQREAMEAILGGRDSLVVLSTGGGKSLCFQAPALAMPGLALVVSPLISLMKDQVDALVGNGVAAACYHSGLEPGAKAALASGIRHDRYRLLYVSPERLVGEGSESFVALLSSHHVSFVAIDEAHCISQWGHDFRPEYRQLKRLRAAWPSAGFHAYTATATARVQRDIADQLELRDPTVLVGSFDRPNLVYRVLARTDLKRQLLTVLERHRDQAGIIYCLSRRETSELADWLTTKGIRAVPYHAGLSAVERARNQDAFLNEEVDVVVATVAFGMGIDRSDVRFVAHAGAPQSLAHYQQESGRAGRDGLEAECVLIYGSGDFVRWRLLLENQRGTPVFPAVPPGKGERGPASHGASDILLREMERYATSVGCRHRHLALHFGDTYTRQSCAACDYCLEELEPVGEPGLLARKILSCVARVDQRFGAAHVTNVLCGKRSEQVRARGHDTLSTFGLLADHDVPEVRGYIEQLLARGLLRQTEDGFPVLSLTPSGVKLLKDASSTPDLTLVRQRRPVKGRSFRRASVETESWQGVDRALFEHLRATRLRIARERGVPPYVIFHDGTLREMARLRPLTLAALRNVYGVGVRKAEDLGEIFLRVIKEREKGNEGDRK